MPGIKDGAFNDADNLLAPFKPTRQERFREFESISAVGYNLTFGIAPPDARSRTTADATKGGIA